MTSTTGYADYQARRNTHAFLAGEVAALVYSQDHLQDIMRRFTLYGSGSTVSPDSDFNAPFFFFIGSSTCVIKLRPIETTPETGSVPESRGISDILKLTVVEQMQEVQAALSLNKSQLARVLRVSRPTLYDWLRGKEPNPVNCDRLATLLLCLGHCRVSGARPLNARFVRQPTDLDQPALIDLLSAEPLDEDRLVGAIERVHALGDEANQKRATREEQLRDLGFEDPGLEQRREQLARNLAFRQ